MTVRATTPSEVQEGVRGSARVAIRAGGTKSRPADDATVIDLTTLAGITEYSPAECVITARPGTRLVDLERTLAAEGQYLPFDPPLAIEGATIGGTVASGVSGSRRYRYGGIRDFLIGVRVVDGEGRMIRSGGTVVKNAAGFLLHHGMVGSLGQFGVLTELTFKVFPQPEARRTITLECGSADRAFAAARAVEQLRRDCEAIDFNERGTLWLELAGRASALESRAELLVGQLQRLALDVSGESGGPGVNDRQACGGGKSLSAEHLSSVFHDRSPSDPRNGGCVKVAGMMSRWQELRHHVTAVHFMSAGGVAWLATTDLDALAQALANAQLTGLVIRGARAGTRLGHLPHNEFEARVRRVLDPRDLFCATQDPSR